MNHEIVCPTCAKAAQTSSRTKTIVLLALGAAVLVALLAYLVPRTPLRKPEPEFDYGPFRAQVESLRKRLSREPCDRRTVDELGEALNKAGDYRGTTKEAGRFFEKCGEYPYLRWKTYYAHKRLGEWDPAIRDATVLIQDDPDDFDFWWWRGDAYEQSGRLEEAAADYRQALLIDPKLEDTPFRLSNALEKLGRHCEAVTPIEEFLHYHPEHHDDERVRSRLRRLRTAGSCKPSETGTGTAVIEYRPDDPSIETTAVINGQEKRFVVDTGATLVAISAELAEELGIEPSAREYNVITASGRGLARVGVASTIAIQSLEVRLVPVAIFEEMPGDVDGLLGLSFLSRFDMRFDADDGTLTLSLQDEP